jgi:hypothetical protein
MERKTSATFEPAIHQEMAVGEPQEKPARDLEDPEWIAAQKSYFRKLDWIILPMISLLYFFEYLDRGNIAVGGTQNLTTSFGHAKTDDKRLQNAKLYGYAEGHLTATQGAGNGHEPLSDSEWQLCVMMFYVGLVLFQVPGCIGYRIFPPSKVNSDTPVQLTILG